MSRLKPAAIGATAITGLLAAVPLPTVVVVRDSGLPLGASADAVTLFGAADADSPYPLWSSAWLDPMQRDAFFALMGDQATVSGFECGLRTIDGREGWFALAGRPLSTQGRDVVSISVVDLGRRHEVEASLRQSSTRLRAVIDAVSVALVVVPCDGAATPQLANAAALRLLGQESAATLAAAGGIEGLLASSDLARLNAAREIAAMAEAPAHLSLDLRIDPTVPRVLELDVRRLAGAPPCDLLLLHPFGRTANSEVETLRQVVGELERHAHGLATQAAVLGATLETMDHAVVVTDPDLAVVAWNTRYCDQFELPTSLTQRSFTYADVIAHRAQVGEFGSGPVDREVARQVEQAAAAQPFSAEVERPDGTVLEVRSRPRPGGGFVRTYADITRRKRMEAELRDSRQRLLTILNTSPIAVEIVPLDRGRPGPEVLFHNPRMADLLGWGQTTVTGVDPMARYVDPAELDRLLGHLHEYGHVQDFEVQWQRTDRTPLWVLASAWPLVYQGRTALIGWYYDITERKRVEAALIVAATVDALSGAYARAHFLDRLEQEVRKAQRYARPLSLLAIDIDHFKRVNDTHGHLVGDDVIRMVARTCRQTLRDVDLLGRTGGEEFVACLPETPLHRGIEAAERVRVAIARAGVPVMDTSVQVTASLGVAALHSSETAITALMKRADDALYTAKRNGRNRVEAEIALPPTVLE